MEFTIDNCQQFIISTLRKGLNSHRLNSTEISWASYDVHLSAVVQQFMAVNKIPNPDNISDVVGISNFQKTERIKLIVRLAL